MPANTVEATLSSKYVDGISRGLEATKAAFQQNLHTMNDAAAFFSGIVSAAFNKVDQTMADWIQNFQRRSREAKTEFGQIGFAATAAFLVVGQAVLAGSRALALWISGLAREASEVTELKLAYEGLARSTGWHLDTISKLKQATEGQVAATEMLSNANRVMQSGVRVSDAMYIELSENIFKLAKSAKVDGAKALDALTDALIKGNARGFQAIGLHLNVKDAISQMAEMTGQQANRLQQSAVVQAFYNELLEKTRQAVAKLPPDFISLNDLIERGQRVWRAYFTDIGGGINRSQVLQQLMQRLSAELANLGNKEEDIDRVAQATNRFFIGFLRYGDATLRILSWLSIAFDGVWGVAKVTVNGLATLLSAAITGILGMSMVILQLAEALPGEVGQRASKAITRAIALAGEQIKVTEALARKTASSFDGIGDNYARLNALADTAGKLAKEMEQFQQGVVRGTATLREQGETAQQTATDLKALSDQIRAYRDLQRELAARLMTGEQQAIARFAETLGKIDQLTLVSEQKRGQLRLQALRVYLAERQRLVMEAARKEEDLLREGMDIFQAVNAASGPIPSGDSLDVISGGPARRADEDAKKISVEAEKARREEQRKRTDDLLSSVTTLNQAMEAIQLGKLTGRIEKEVFEQTRKSIEQLQLQIQELSKVEVIGPEQIDQILRLEEALNRLNYLNMTPFQQMLQDVKGSLANFATAATDAWSSLWADLVSGQENAGKKFLAALLNFFSQEMLAYSVRFAALAAAHALILDFGGAARYAAAAAGLAAAAGVIRGLASTMAQTNQAGVGGSFQQNVPRPVSQQVQVINVGAAGRAQNQGEAMASRPAQVELKVSFEKGVAVQEVKNELRRNGQLRLAIERA